VRTVWARRHPGDETFALDRSTIEAVPRGQFRERELPTHDQLPARLLPPLTHNAGPGASIADREAPPHPPGERGFIAMSAVLSAGDPGELHEDARTCVELLAAARVPDEMQRCFSPHGRSSFDVVRSEQRVEIERWLDRLGYQGDGSGSCVSRGRPRVLLGHLPPKRSICRTCVQLRRAVVQHRSPGTRRTRPHRRTHPRGPLRRRGSPGPTPRVGTPSRIRPVVTVDP
jgi:hypothetical protein